MTEFETFKNTDSGVQMFVLKCIIKHIYFSQKALILEAAPILALTAVAWNELLASTWGPLQQPESLVVLKSRANARIKGKKGEKKKKNISAGCIQAF